MKRSITSRILTYFSLIAVFVITGWTQASAQCSQFTTVSDTFCTNDPTITLVGTPSPGTFFGTGVTGSSFSPSTAGAGNWQIGYVANSCSDTAFITLTVNQLPNITLTIPSAPVNQRSVCEFDAPYVITGNNPNPGFPTGWFTGNGVDSTLGIFTPASNLLGYNVITYNYDDGVCAGTAVDSIEVKENPVAVIDPAFPDVCISDPFINLTQGSGTPLGGTFTYTGSGVSGSQSTGFIFTPINAGLGTHPITYCYTFAGCETCVTQNITVNDVPNVTFNPAASPQCENGGIVDLTPFGTPVGGKFFGPGVQADSLTLRTGQMGGPGTYTLTYQYTDSNGCSQQATQPITVNPKPVVTVTSNSPATTPPVPTDPANVLVKICLDDTAFVSFTSTPAGTVISVDPNQGYVNNGGVYEFSPTDDQLYQVIMRSAGCQDTGSINVDVIPPAVADISGPPSICIGDTTELVASGATNYTWITPTATGSTVSVTPKVNTTFQVVADSDVDGDGNQCSSDTGEFFLVVNPLPLITTSRDTTLFYGDEGTLVAYGGSSYVWSEGVMGELSCFECPTPNVFPIFDATQPPKRGYQVIGTDSNGCVNSDSIYVNLNTRIVIFVPTAFSPNGDGVNDVLELEAKGIASIDFEIFDRFGKTVFETKTLGDGWDGKVDGEIANKDVYLYRLNAVPYEKTVAPISQAGEITLIR